jgi:hypothetical protein
MKCALFFHMWELLKPFTVIWAKLDTPKKRIQIGTQIHTHSRANKTGNPTINKLIPTKLIIVRGCGRPMISMVESPHKRCYRRLKIPKMQASTGLFKFSPDR